VFYYSETRYLYMWNKVEDSYAKGELLGFARIIIRDTRGSIKIQFNDASGTKFSMGNLVVYEGKGSDITRIVTTKTLNPTQVEELYTFPYEEASFHDSGIWFDCVIELSGGGMIGESADSYVQRERSKKSYEQIVIVPKQEEAKTIQVVENWKENQTMICESEEQGNIGPEPIEVQSKQKEIQNKDTTETDLWKNIYVADLNRISETNPKWMKYRSNSFLLHGFYNYKHVIATDTVLGVPGNYYDKEKQVAEMFGFPIFVPVKELKTFLENAWETDESQLSPSIFGYYIRQEF